MPVWSLIARAVVALVAAFGSTALAQTGRPNVLIVLLDDAGFMDFSAYGSDSATPNIDRLGESGVKFTRYYTSPLCGPSRAALMTGQDNHVVGAGTLAEVLTEQMRALPAYSMTWRDDQQTIATRLKAAGYQTFVTGKWGIGDIGANLPHRFGFDRSWVLDATGASNYEAKPYLPLYRTVGWFEDGEQVALPEDFYSSRNIVDKMIEYLESANADQPFFAFVSFQALHVPVQVPRDYVDKYNGVFDRGWDQMRAERLNRAIELGLVPAGTRLSDGAHGDRDWNALSADEQGYWARAMQVNAGMMEAADFHLGRLLDHLRANGQLDNTVVIVTSDNGPEYNTMGKTSPPAERAFERLWMAIEGWDVATDNLGQPGSMAAIGQEWAAVSAAPLNLFKFTAAEGGLRVPLVISGPGVEKLGFVSSRAQVADITPTILDLAGIPHATDEFYGRSLRPVLQGLADEVYADNDSFAFEVSGAAALFRGNWKLTRTPEPFGDGQWRLYDLASDPGERVDLADKHPDIREEMIAEYQTYAGKVGVFEMAPGDSARMQLTVNALKKTAVNYWHLLLALALVLCAIVYGLVRSARLLVAAVRRGRAT